MIVTKLFFVKATGVKEPEFYGVYIDDLLVKCNRAGFGNDWVEGLMLGINQTNHSVLQTKIMRVSEEVWERERLRKALPKSLKEALSLGKVDPERNFGKLVALYLESKEN